MNLKVKINTALKLGLTNLGRVFFYRIGIKTGINPIKRLNHSLIVGRFFRSLNTENIVHNVCTSNGSTIFTLHPFGYKDEIELSTIDWHQSCLNGQKVLSHKKPWYQISDFDVSVGDIKGVWEASRFDWVFPLALKSLTGDQLALQDLNLTLQSWVQHNPAYLGPNWKCGQEASIRVMHIAMAAKLLNQVETPELALLSFVKGHLARIAPTISYAVAQDNNHGTSEAAALFIGGSWLSLHGDPSGNKWMKLGRKWLENRAKRLIEEDGSFSQYSVNYHRVMLDTYSMVEIWRTELNLPIFSDLLYQRLKAATNWLYQLVQKETGDVPNLGANDGARLLPLSSTDYRDFRPSVQLASVLFFKQSAWLETGLYDQPLTLLGIQKPNQNLEPVSHFHFPNGGYFGIRSSNHDAFVMMTYPKFLFRPSQCDALHVDFWLKGKNLLRDGGTFSYNAGDDYIQYYGGIKSHNTIEFDGRDQMPRLSRFLLGNWLKADEISWEQDSGSCQAAYVDSDNAKHKRHVSLDEQALTIIDDVSGFKDKAILRWRLQPGEWVVEGLQITNGNHVITIKTELQINCLKIIKGCESRYYYHESAIPVLEIEVASAGRITTEYKY